MWDAFFFFFTDIDCTYKTAGSMKMKGVKHKTEMRSYAELPVLECITARHQWSPKFKIIIQ